MKSKMLLIISFLLGFGFLQIQCSFKQKDNDMAPVDKLRSKLDRFVKDNIENANIKTEEFYSGFLKLIEEVDVFEDARLKVFTLAFAECKEKLEVAEKLVSERRIAIQLEEQKLSKEQLIALWEEGWKCFLDAIESLSPVDLEKTIYIRTEALSVPDALNRQFAHYPYHVGQIVYLGKMIKDKE